MPAPTEKTKPLRLDAERNRAAILTAAATVYAERGSHPSLEEVAKLAGVGVGTVYRRFPTKGLLIEALLEATMRDYAERIEAFAVQAETEPWEAFRGHVMSLVHMQANDRAFSEVIADPTSSSDAFRDHHDRALRASLALTARAQSAGVLREDFHHRDLLILTRASHGIVAAGDPEDVGDPVRLAELFLDGLRRH